MASTARLVVACVYRFTNAAHVLAAVASVPGADVRLWALDETHPELAAWTVGRGKGPRLALLNAALAGAGPGDVVILDDDVAFTHGDLRRFVRLARAARLDLGQPAQERSGHWTYKVTVARRASLVRLTSFVEVGPVVFLAAAMRGRLLPFPEEFGMGWGLDIVWSDLFGQGSRLGVVDATRLRHLGEMGKEYATSPEEERLAPLLAERGVTDMDDFARTVDTWPWSGAYRVAAGLRGVRR